MAHDDFDLVKLAHLYGYIRENAQQTAFAVTDNALYHNTFLSQCSDLLRVDRVGFPLDCHHSQGSLAASVVENHDTPLAAEIGGIHGGCLWQRAIGLCSGFGEVAADAFDAASVLRGKLCGGLLAVAVKLPEGVRLKSAAAAETLVASGTFVALFAITGTVLLDLF